MNARMVISIWLLLVGVLIFLVIRQRDLAEASPINVVHGGLGSKWESCPVGTYLGHDGECELTEFVPDLPQRMWRFEISNAPVAVDDEPILTLSRGNFGAVGALNIASLGKLSCIYVNGKRVRFVVRERVGCKNQVVGDLLAAPAAPIRPLRREDLPAEVFQ